LIEYIKLLQARQFFVFYRFYRLKKFIIFPNNQPAAAGFWVALLELPEFGIWQTLPSQVPPA